MAYDDPALHGGFAAWPSGSPDDPPVAAASFAVSSLDLPVAATSVADSAPSVRRLKPPPLEANRSSSAVAANNWRLARVDGDGNGEINLADITPIAAHWQERSDGYRVYRKAPGASAYTALPYTDVTSGGGGSPPSFDITLLRSDAYPEGASQADPARPLRLDLTDDEARGDLLGIGVYSYYVAAYDSQTDTEGPKSPVLSLDLATGNFNLAPVAKLNVSPDFAGAPAQITLDASESYDLDGSITSFEWDFDADGAVDYTSSDPAPPEQSSGGEIDTIEPGASDAVVSARYTQGGADYLYPRVRVVDDLGAASAWAQVKLGISGWETRVLNETMDNYEMGLWPDAIGRDPLTHQLVIAGRAGPSYIAEVGTGLYLAREESPGQWSYEAVINDLSEEEVWAYVPRYILWDEHNQPLLLIQHYLPVGVFSPQTTDIYTAQRESNGVWDVQFQFYSSDSDHSFNGSRAVSPVVPAPGRFAALVGEGLIDPGSTVQNSFYTKYYMLFYDHGAWSLEYTGIDNRETAYALDFLYSNLEGSICCLVGNTPETPSGIWQIKWQDGIGFGEPERIDDGSLSFPSGTYPREGLVDSTGTMYATHSGSQDGRDPVFVKMSPSGTSLTPLKSIMPGEPLAQVLLAYTPNLHLVNGGAGFFMLDTAQDSAPVARYYRLENQTWIAEDLLSPAFAQYEQPRFLYTHTGPDEKPVALLKHTWAVDLKPWVLYMLAVRVDPRT